VVRLPTLAMLRCASGDTASVSADAITVMRSWFDAWNRADLDAFAELYAVDAVMKLPDGWIETGTLTGRPAIRSFFEGLKEAWEGEDSAVVRELFTAGDVVVSRMTWQVRGRVSGIDTSLDVTNINEVENGAIVRQQHYLDDAEALAAAGLSGSRRSPPP
jgi:ketosteroid isomerase-like protein